MLADEAGWSWGFEKRWGSGGAHFRDDTASDGSDGLTTFHQKVTKSSFLNDERLKTTNIDRGKAICSEGKT
jgi:hypothetical protein